MTYVFGIAPFCRMSGIIVTSSLIACGMSLVNRIRCLSVPVLLCLVATLHIVRVHTFDQSAWGAGCGFGMFSKVDYHGSRIHRCIVETDRGEFRVDLYQHYPEWDFQAKVLPTDANLRRLAQAVAESSWAYAPLTSSPDSAVQISNVSHSHGDRSSAPLLQRCDDDSHPVNIYNVRVEQWRVRFDTGQGLIESWKAKQVCARPRNASESGGE